jgi:hypothetical protein
MQRLNGDRMRLAILGILAGIVFGAGRAKADFTFGEPTNLGPTINTSLNEAAVVTSADDLSPSFVRWAQGGPFETCLSARATTDAIFTWLHQSCPILNVEISPNLKKLAQ